MTIKKQELFKFSDYWPWALVLSIITLVPIKAITYNNGHLPIGAWISIAGAILCAWGISTLRFALRKEWIDSIRFYTAHGTAVYGLGDERVAADFSNKLDVATDEVINFWTGKTINNVIIGGDSLRNVINGSTLGLSASPIIEGGNSSFASRIVKGASLGSQMMIWYEATNVDETIKVFKHELGHLCLDTIGITDEDAAHHVMAANNFPY